MFVVCSLYCSFVNSAVEDLSFKLGYSVRNVNLFNYGHAFLHTICPTVFVLTEVKYDLHLYYIAS